MKLTPRGYPYPECDPPLTKDVSDAPLQTRALAEAMNDDLAAVRAQIDDTYRGLTTILTLSVSTSVSSNEAIPFDTVELDEAGWANGSSVVLDQPGLFLLTGYAGSVAGSNVQNLGVQFLKNSTLGFHLQGTSPASSGFGHMTSSTVVDLLAGDALQLRPRYSGTVPSNFDNCRFSVSRLVKF